MRRRARFKSTKFKSPPPPSDRSSKQFQQQVSSATIKFRSAPTKALLSKQSPSQPIGRCNYRPQVTYLLRLAVIVIVVIVSLLLASSPAATTPLLNGGGGGGDATDPSDSAAAADTSTGTVRRPPPIGNQNEYAYEDTESAADSLDAPDASVDEPPPPPPPTSPPTRSDTGSLSTSQTSATSPAQSRSMLSALLSNIDKQWKLAEVALIITISAILNLITIVGNIMVLISFKMDRSLQTVSNYFLLSLALADLLIGLISMPLYTLYLLLNYWPLGPLMCDIWLAIDYLNSNAAVLNMLIISFDRYFSVTRPLTYRAKRTTKHACLMISCAWILSLTIWTPAIFTYPHYNGRTVQGTDKCEIEFVKDNTYLTFVTAILAFYIPVIIMIYLYWRIWLETKKRYRDLTTLFLVSGVGAAAPVRTARPPLCAPQAQLAQLPARSHSQQAHQQQQQQTTATTATSATIPSHSQQAPAAICAGALATRAQLRTGSSASRPAQPLRTQQSSGIVAMPGTTLSTSKAPPPQTPNSIVAQNPLEPLRSSRTGNQNNSNSISNDNSNSNQTNKQRLDCVPLVDGSISGSSNKNEDQLSTSQRPLQPETNEQRSRQQQRLSNTNSTNDDNNNKSVCHKPEPEAAAAAAAVTREQKAPVIDKEVEVGAEETHSIKRSPAATPTDCIQCKSTNNGRNTVGAIPVRKQAGRCATIVVAPVSRSQAHLTGANHKHLSCHHNHSHHHHHHHGHHHHHNHRRHRSHHAHEHNHKHHQHHHHHHHNHHHHHHHEHSNHSSHHQPQKNQPEVDESVRLDATTPPPPQPASPPAADRKRRVCRCCCRYCQDPSQPSAIIHPSPSSGPQVQLAVPPEVSNEATRSSSPIETTTEPSPLSCCGPARSSRRPTSSRAACKVMQLRVKEEHSNWNNIDPPASSSSPLAVAALLAADDPKGSPMPTTATTRMKTTQSRAAIKRKIHPATSCLPPPLSSSPSSVSAKPQTDPASGSKCMLSSQANDPGRMIASEPLPSGMMKQTGSEPVTANKRPSMEQTQMEASTRDPASTGERGRTLVDAACSPIQFSSTPVHTGADNNDNDDKFREKGKGTLLQSPLASESEQQQVNDVDKSNEASPLSPMSDSQRSYLSNEDDKRETRIVTLGDNRLHFFETIIGQAKPMSSPTTSTTMTSTKTTSIKQQQQQRSPACKLTSATRFSRPLDASKLEICCQSPAPFASTTHKSTTYTGSGGGRCRCCAPALALHDIQCRVCRPQRKLPDAHLSTAATCPTCVRQVSGGGGNKKRRSVSPAPSPSLSPSPCSQQAPDSRDKCLRSEPIAQLRVGDDSKALPLLDSLHSVAAESSHDNNGKHLASKNEDIKLVDNERGPAASQRALPVAASGSGKATTHTKNQASASSAKKSGQKLTFGDVYSAPNQKVNPQTKVSSRQGTKGDSADELSDAERIRREAALRAFRGEQLARFQDRSIDADSTDAYQVGCESPAATMASTEIGSKYASQTSGANPNNGATRGFLFLSTGSLNRLVVLGTIFDRLRQQCLSRLRHGSNASGAQRPNRTTKSNPIKLTTSDAGDRIRRYSGGNLNDAAAAAAADESLIVGLKSAICNYCRLHQRPNRRQRRSGSKSATAKTSCQDRSGPEGLKWIRKGADESCCRLQARKRRGNNNPKIRSELAETSTSDDDGDDDDEDYGAGKQIGAGSNESSTNSIQESNNNATKRPHQRHHHSTSNLKSPNSNNINNNNTQHQQQYSTTSSTTTTPHHPIQPKSERKAAKTLSTLLLVFIVTWLPYNILVLIKTLSGGESQVPEKIWNFSYYLCYINSTINPLCYALCNAQFRRTYMRILKCKLSNEHNSTRRLVPIQSSVVAWNKESRATGASANSANVFANNNNNNNQPHTGPSTTTTTSSSSRHSGY